MLNFYKLDGKLLFSNEELNLEKVGVGTVDAAKEKHVPHVEVNGKHVHVQVGEVVHPMLDAHFIEFILLETNKGLHQAILKPGMEPVADFMMQDDEELINVYEHCNLHGVWAIK